MESARDEPTRQVLERGFGEINGPRLADGLNPIALPWTLTYDATGSQYWLNVNAIGAVAGSSASLLASNPTPTFDVCGHEVAATVRAAVAFAPSCQSAAISETSTFPPYTSFGQTVPGTVKTGTGTLTLTTSPLTFQLSSPSQVPIPALPGQFMVPVSTGDTPQIQTTASSNTYPISVVYNYTTANQYSTCTAALSLNGQGASGTGSVSTRFSASPAGCSGVFAVSGSIGGTPTQNGLYVVVPPQSLLQVMYGEAGGQALRYGASDLTEQAVGQTIRFRFNNPEFGHLTTFQDAIAQPAQYDGYNATTQSRTTGTSPELANAASVFAGNSTVDVGGSPCFFSPTATGWGAIQSALNTPTTVLPVVAKDPVCYRSKANTQFVYKPSISINVNGSGAPAIVFERWRQQTDPAVVQIP